MTKQQFFKRCQQDPVFFIENCIYIKNSQDGSSFKFKLWDFQKDYINSFKSPSNPQGQRFHLVLKSRQLGMSTTTLAFILHKAIFQKNAKIVIACKKLNDASKMLTDEIYFMLEHLPSFMQPAIKEKNKNRIHFAASNSWIQAVAASPGALRQYQATHVVFDEFAFYNDIQAGLDAEMYRAALPSFQRDGFCTIISTPNGLGNMYADYCLAAKANNLPNWWYKELSWRLREERLYDKDGNFDNGESFKQSVLALPNGKRIWAAEYDCQLLASGNTVFDVENIEITTTKQEPLSNMLYYIGADVAGGGGGDYSVAQVLDQAGNQVFTYRNNQISPKEFGIYLNQLGKRYNTACIAVERNNHGHTTIQELENLGYRNLYRAEDGKLGFNTIEKTKIEIIANLDAMFKSGLVKLSDKDTLDEIRTFIHIGAETHSSKMGAASGKHDDTVMSLAIAAHLLNTRASAIRRTLNHMI